MKLTNILTICAAIFLASCASQPAQPPVQLANMAPEEIGRQPLPLVRKLAKAGDVRAQVELARRLGGGLGMKADPKKAVELLLPLAEKGDALAQYYVGTAYGAGAGVEYSEEKALIYYQAAAWQGQRDAEFRVAMMILNGRGGAVGSWSSALPWLQRAAEQDLAEAQFQLGNAYATGADIEGLKDGETAARWYRRAIKSTTDNAAAIDRLRLLIRRGDVVPQPGDPVDETPAVAGTAP